jgi:anti-sigma B factor antagonist
MAIIQRQWTLPSPPRRRSRTACDRQRGAPTAREHAAPAAPSRAGPPWRILLIALPAHVDESNAAQVRTDLLTAVEDRPHVLVADLSGTRWCDWAGAGALASAFRRAAAGGTELRLVLTDPSVRRVISVNGLDRLMPVYESVPAASAVPPGGSVTSPYAPRQGTNVPG